MNKQKLEKILIIALCFILLAGVGVLAFLLVQKFNSMETIAKEEHKYQADYTGVSAYEHDADIHIDGVLDETVWENKKWYTDAMLDDVDGELPTLAVTGFCTEYGIYLASTVDDENLLNDNQMSIKKNSYWDFYVTADNVGEEQSADALYTTRFVIDMLGYVLSENPFVETAVVVDGELNSAETKGATLEMFIPWSTVEGIDTEKGIPTEFRLLPNYSFFVDGEDVSTLIGGGIGTYLTWDYYRFNQDGYMTADREGAIVGDAKSGYAKTGNWDVSKEEEGIVRASHGTKAHYIYFTEEYGSNYIVETTIVPIQTLNKDPWPKAGIHFLNKDNKYHTVFLDMRESELVKSVNGTKNFGKYMLVTLDNYESSWNQVSLSKHNSDNVNASKREGVKLTVIKYGSKFFYFVDGKFVTSEEKEFMDGDVFPGFHSLSADVIYKNYSCKKIDKEEVQSILNKQKVYFIDAEATNTGGTVKTSIVSAKPGDDCEVTITSRSGYEVSSILVNGKEKIQDARKNAKDGIYTISNINRNYDIQVTFTKNGKYDITGILQNVPANSAAQVVVTGVTNKIFRCETDIVKNNKFKVSVPEGKYQVAVVVEGYTELKQQVTINKDKEIKFNFKVSEFLDTVEVNNKTVNSNKKNWNLSNEVYGKISTSYELDGNDKPLYFNTSAQNFALETTIKYTTDFKSGIEYQPDGIAGFHFSDGTNTAWIAVNKTGVVVTNWKRYSNLVNYSVLTYPEKRPVKFAIAKLDNDVYIYMDDRLVSKIKWSDIAPKISADSKVAIGFWMSTKKPVDIEFSDYKVHIGYTAANDYVKSHVTKDVIISGNPDFAKELNINGKVITSVTDKWNVTDVSKGIITATEAAKMQPLYFAKHGSTVAIETTIEYTTDFKDGVEYQPDLMGGFIFTDGTNTGYIMARQKGLVYTGYTTVNDLIDHAVLMSKDKVSVKFAVVLKDNYIYAFINDEYVFKTKVSSVVPNVADNADLAFGLSMIAAKKADIKFSNIRIFTYGPTVDTYLENRKN